MVREDTAEDAKLPHLPSTCETHRTPPRTKCSEPSWHTVVRTTDPTVSKFLPFLFQNAPGIVLQLQTLLASLLFTNDRQVSSLGQCSRCPGHPGTWHSTEREEGRWQSLAEQWDGLRSCPTCQGVLVARFSQNTTPKKRSVAPTFLLIACSSFWWEQGPAVSQPNCEQLGDTVSSTELLLSPYLSPFLRKLAFRRIPLATVPDQAFRQSHGKTALWMQSRPATIRMHCVARVCLFLP